jgi:hypothetical protein
VTCRKQVRDEKQAGQPVHVSHLRGCGEHFMGGDLAYQYCDTDLQLRNSTGLGLTASPVSHFSLSIRGSGLHEG